MSTRTRPDTAQAAAVADKTRRFAAYLVASYPDLFGISLDADAPPITEETVVRAVDKLETSIRGWWAAWKTHPAFEDALTHEPHNPVVVGICRHPAGAGGKTESHIISNLQDVTSPAQQRWNQRSLGGQLVRIEPVTRNTPVSWCRTLAVGYALKGAGNAWRARARLKELLPRALHPLISLARKWNRRRKLDFLKDELDFEEFRAILRNPKDRSLYPQWYLAHTKAELWAERVLEPGQRAALEQFIDPNDFWKCAVGKVPYDEIETRFKCRQLRLFD